MVTGFVFGQLLGLVAAAGTISSVGATGENFMLVLQKGMNSGLGAAILWAAAFSLAEKIAGGRAAVMG